MVILEISQNASRYLFALCELRENNIVILNIVFTKYTTII